MSKITFRGFLLHASAPAALLIAGGAHAQSAPSEGVSLGEVVVTATRTASTVNKVAMSVSAVGQKDIDQSGIQNFQDLARMTPSLTYTPGALNGDNNISIRGIPTGVGAPTTAVYLDDAQMQKRNTNLNGDTNGAPLPPLFDIDRVEVLRGPQGTLFGGSTMGGAVRYILPTPSVTKWSMYAKGGVSTVENGGVGGEAGVAIGGPIVQDKLGFRGSVYFKRQAGYIDHVNMLNSSDMGQNTNWQQANSERFALLWQPTSRLKVQAAVLGSNEHVNDVDGWWQNVPATFSNGGSFSNTGTINGVKFAFAPKAFGAITNPAYNMFGPYKTGNNYYANVAGTGDSRLQRVFRDRTIFMPSLVIDYDAGPVQIHSSTTYLHTHESGETQGKYGSGTTIGISLWSAAPNASFVNALGQPSGSGTCGQGVTAMPDTSVACAPLFVPSEPNVIADIFTDNDRRSFTQEIRFASNPDARPFSWVAGLYYYQEQNFIGQNVYDNSEQVALDLTGRPYAWSTGVLSLPGPAAYGGSDRYYQTNGDAEQEEAGFGELNWYVTEKLKLTAGVRIDHLVTTLNHITGGAGQGTPVGWSATSPTTITNPNSTLPFPTNTAACPTTNGALGCPFQQGFAKIDETPITPKFGVSYQLDPGKLVYFTAAKGYRSGGIQQQPVSQSICPVDFAALGITQLPLSFQGDSLWSYELGSKLRFLGGKAQINSSLFYIDWTNPVVNFRLATCGKSYVGNAPKSISEGFDSQGEWRPFGGLTLTYAVAYTHAYYPTSLISPGAKPVTNITKGDLVAGVPDWTGSWGFRYDFQLAGMPTYVTANQQYIGKYVNGAGPLDTGYEPVTYNGNILHMTNMRAGMVYRGADISLWVNNLFNSQELTAKNHQTDMALITVASQRPREIGVTTTYRF